MEIGENRKRERLSMLGLTLIMVTLLMMPEMTMQGMERKGDLGKLISNTSQKQQGIFQWDVKQQRPPRATLLQEKLVIQLDKVGLDQLGEKSDQNVTKTRNVVTTITPTRQSVITTVGNNLTLSTLIVIKDINISHSITRESIVPATKSTTLMVTLEGFNGTTAITNVGGMIPTPTTTFLKVNDVTEMTQQIVIENNIGSSEIVHDNIMEVQDEFFGFNL
ncbi:hypothetical protein J4Q44_G00162410, partial [Coregonus suidteri]